MNSIENEECLENWFSLNKSYSGDCFTLLGLVEKELEKNKFEYKIFNEFRSKKQKKLISEFKKNYNWCGRTYKAITDYYLTRIDIYTRRQEYLINKIL
tara:strand:+ start:1448 stop:1741 length:294 start_codon:yes stop_codon:yes gene_type:complete